MKDIEGEWMRSFLSFFFICELVMNPPHPLTLFLSSMSSILKYRAYESSLCFLVVIRRLVLEFSVKKIQNIEKESISNSNEEIIKKILFPDISIDQIFEAIAPFRRMSERFK